MNARSPVNDAVCVDELRQEVVSDEAARQPADGLHQRRHVAQRAVQAAAVVLGAHRQVAPAVSARRRHVLLDAQVDGDVLVKRLALRHAGADQTGAWAGAAGR